ncbi:MAG: 5-bromo-4-chloroindolyl phosphate hydrolysis family protein [Streptococcaceae bacterium]|jgi:5-bromo-4-chloroindolyl phosphate hydrolysis protein|nr:5-bromo-4-chloroindolyl phosphate hydrolysis family protein [Streptococcaceae bacterium]
MTNKRKLILRILGTILILNMITVLANLGSFALLYPAVILAVLFIWLRITTVLKWFLPITLLFYIFSAALPTSTLSLIFLILISYLAGEFVFPKLQARAQSKKEARGKPDKEKQYHAAGLNDQDIEAFRSTMAEAKQNIIDWERNITKSPTLSQINHETNGLTAAKELFKEIVETPKRITEADTFLYKHLPSVVSLTDKYLKITEHKIKAESTLETLAKSEGVIWQVSEQIALDYTSFISEVLEDLVIETEVAKSSLKEK